MGFKSQLNSPRFKGNDVFGPFFVQPHRGPSKQLYCSNDSEGGLVTPLFLR